MEVILTLNRGCQIVLFLDHNKSDDFFCEHLLVHLKKKKMKLSPNRLKEVALLLVIRPNSESSVVGLPHGLPHGLSRE